MSHDPNNKDCPLNTPVKDRYLVAMLKRICTCPPSEVDRVEEIRARHDATLFVDWGFDREAQPHSFSNAKQCHADRAYLLAELDKARAEKVCCREYVQNWHRFETDCGFLVVRRESEDFCGHCGGLIKIKEPTNDLP